MKNGHALKIEKGIPIPQSHCQKGYAETMRKMKVGDSVVLPTTASNAAYQQAVQVWGQLSCKTRKEAGGWRVWRIK